MMLYVHTLNLIQITRYDKNGTTIIIESVDSISRDGPDTPIYVIHYKKLKAGKPMKFLTLIFIICSKLSIKTKNVH